MCFGKSTDIFRSARAQNARGAYITHTFLYISKVICTDCTYISGQIHICILYIRIYVCVSGFVIKESTHKNKLKTNTLWMFFGKIF